MKKQFKKGFSLLELVLVLGVGATMGLIKFQDMKTEQENILASAVGQQMKQMGEAVNGYINIRYDKLSTLSNAAGNGSDPGPRMCSGSACEITYTTLINEGLLPSTFSGLNAQKSAYKIILKRDGLSPNYVVNGLITTTLPWSEGAKIRYDLLGKAMLSAGVDSGMTKSNTVASGYEGQWTEKASDFRNITAEGLLAYRTGFNSALYTVYLRRDGTLPMTGDLNMGGKNIGNAANITASGTGTFGGDISSAGNITTAKEVIAHNGYGDAIKIGGDASGNDYEIVLMADKPLSIHMKSNNTNINAVNITGGLTVYGKTIFQKDSLVNGDITSSGNISTGGILHLGQVNLSGSICDNTGDVSRDMSGNILTCQSGIWQGASFNTITRTNKGYESISVSCASDEQLTGGGAQCDPGSSERLKWSNPRGNGWAAACPRVNLTVYAICSSK
ncbi:shufflon system plasmid conjugative transfer pilus tip adhesin PilV [Klebsiella sp. K4-172]|uniref:shufflon system plasmid conjugative transfer pilus tip adhesin PilV n=1 Tax=Klebsiella sp. K4-172 TaxID=2920185 RepID=UPI003907F782